MLSETPKSTDSSTRSFGGMQQRCLDVLSLQPGVRVEEVFFPGPLSELADDEIDRIRVPRITGLPSMTSGRISIRSRKIMSGLLDRNQERGLVYRSKT
jgi:hypothetical protein